MKFSKRLVFRSLLSLLLAVCILSGGLLLMGMAEAEDKTVETDSLAPDVSDLIDSADDTVLPDITDTSAPASREQLTGKFGKYSFASVENGKKIVSIYSAEQIADIVNRRENGESFVLSAEDILFIIDDTVNLFSEYDIVSVTGLDGVTVNYPGVSFYSSEEYGSCFGGVDYGTNEYSFNIEKDIWNVILTRVTVLNSTVCNHFGKVYVYVDNDGSINEENIDYLSRCVQVYFKGSELSSEYIFYETLAPHNNGVFVFSGNRYIDYVEQMNCGDRNAAIALYPDGLIPENLDTVKYDVNGKSVVIELWDMNSEKLVARLRYDGDTNAKEVADLENLWEDFKVYLNNGGEEYRHVSGEEYMSSVSDYRIAVFFVGMEGLNGSNRVSAIRFGADSYQDNCQLHFGGGIEEMSEPCQLSGSQAIADYVISLLKEELVTD